MITVRKIEERKYLVLIEDKISRTEHNVELNNDYFEKLSKDLIGG